LNFLERSEIIQDVSKL
jgi:hypothetical protein